MLSEDGRFVLTFNGEIYNYRELKQELAAHGHKFQTDTDTEVLLAAFTEWGVGCLPHLNGMFAFAIWDTKERQLILARDRLGIKPLYYAQVEGENGVSFIFASEVKAILATGLTERAIDPEALNQFLTFLWPTDPHALFRGIKKLPPAQRGDLDSKIEVIVEMKRLAHQCFIPPIIPRTCQGRPRTRT